MRTRFRSTTEIEMKELTINWENSISQLCGKFHTVSEDFLFLFCHELNIPRGEMSTMIKIKYAENVSRADEASDSTSRISSEISSINKELLVNINCNIGLIGDYIRDTCRVEPSEEFDLWEESTNRMKNLIARKSWESGLDVFQPNDTYLLILVERNSSGHLVNYVPLVAGKLPRTLVETITKSRKLSKKKSSLIETPIRDKGSRKKIAEKSK